MEQTSLHVKKIFDNQVQNQELCRLEVEGNNWLGEKKISLTVSKRIWEEMGRVMEWKQSKEKSQ